MAKTKAKPESWLHNNDKLLKIAAWCRKGLTGEQIAANIGISKTTFYRWTKLEIVPEETDLPYRQVNFKGTFGDYLIHAREVDDEIIGALRMSATGYWVEETYLDKKGQPKKVRRWIPPSDKAQAMWLKNRDPNTWCKENEKQADTSALDRLDKILSSLTLSATENAEEEELEDGSDS